MPEYQKEGMKYMKKLMSVVFAVLFALFLSLPAFAADTASNITFVHQSSSAGKSQVAEIPAVYRVKERIDARSVGLEKTMGSITSLDCDPDGNVYALSGEGRIYRFDKDYNFTGTVEITDANGERVDFNGAKGIYAPTVSELYVCDTAHNRILYCVDYKVRQEITLPETSLIPEDFVFNPARVVRDEDGYLYAVCDGCYYGAILYTHEGEFSCFFGANTVKSTVLSALGNLWDRLTMNDVKRAQTVKTLPFQFSDICIDENGFVYTCTGKGEGTGQIRMLSPGGDGILANAENTNFGETETVRRYDAVVSQNFVGIQADGEGLIYAVDKGFGLIYIYDTRGTLLAAFGGGMGTGVQNGNFKAASAICLKGSDVLVADEINSSITVFSLSEFGETYLKAQKHTVKSELTEAKPLWEAVLQQDPINRLALTGLSEAAYLEEDYPAAMSYAKRCGDSSLYSKARVKYQNRYVSDNFWWIFLIAVSVIAGLCVLLVYSVKHEVHIIKNRKLRAPFSAIIHPFETFGEIKEKNIGSVTLAAAFTLLFFLSSAAASIWSDFRYTSYNSDNYNSLFQLLQTSGLILVWTAANWGISTLQEGKGKLKEVFIVTSYSVLPLILYNIVSIPLTYVVADAGSALISGLHLLALILCGVLLSVGLMKIHDYSFFKLLVTALISVLLIILIIFVVFMVGMLLAQFFGFFVEAATELIRNNK